jgi:hypothetical protein
MKKTELNGSNNRERFEKPDFSKDNSEAGASNNFNLFSSNELDNMIKNLSKPAFLGSIHLKKENIPSFSSVETLLKGEHELKMTRALKSTLLNPITKILILSALVFNILWIMFVYLL